MNVPALSTTHPEPFPVCAPSGLPLLDEAHRWLVKDLWPRAGVGIIGGCAKVGKTWLALELAVSVASGSPCFGAFPVDGPGRVLVYAAEDTLAHVRNRLTSICHHHRLSLDQLDMGIIAVPRVRLDVKNDRDRLDSTLRCEKPALLILDPFVRLYRSIDENSASDVSAILGELRLLQRRHDSAIAVIHHARKNGSPQRPGQALRGSGDFHAWNDVTLYIHRSENLISLSVEHRSAPSPKKPFHLSLVDDSPSHGPCLRLLDDSSQHFHDQDARDHKDLPHHLLDILENANKPLSQNQLRSLVKARNQNVGLALKSLQTQGLALRTAAGWTPSQNSTTQELLF